MVFALNLVLATSSDQLIQQDSLTALAAGTTVELEMIV